MSYRRSDWAIVAVAVGLAFCMKLFYSRAGFDELRFVLAPTTWLVERIVGGSFELEVGRGYLSRELRFEIVPSCAGINFMIALFCSLACGLVGYREAMSAKVTWLLTSGLVAYGVTLGANATRIAVGMILHRSDLVFSGLSAERLHRIEGVAVYLLFLCSTFRVVERFLRNRREAA